MRQKSLILEGSPCDTSFHDDGPATVEEAVSRGPDRCPYYDKCYGPQGTLDPKTGHQCIMRYGLEAVQMMHTDRTRIGAQIAKFRALRPAPPKGFIWSPDRKNFEVITDLEAAAGKVAEFAAGIMAGPAAAHVGPDFKDAIAHAMTRDDAIDLSRLDELEGRYGYNGGRGCDVLEGPCSCGAWH